VISSAHKHQCALFGLFNRHFHFHAYILPDKRVSNALPILNEFICVKLKVPIPRFSFLQVEAQWNKSGGPYQKLKTVLPSVRSISSSPLAKRAPFTRSVSLI
jgi:hypothetical protein